MTLHAPSIIEAIPVPRPDYDLAWRLHLIAVAREKRAIYFDLARRCEEQPWRMCQRIFPNGLDGYEERDLAREEWIEALTELSEARRQETNT